MLIKNPIILLLLAFITATSAIGLPMAQILKYEHVHQNGTNIKFKCQAYDPYDPFMGRYVRFRLEEQVLKSQLFPEESNELYYRQDTFVQVSADENGYVQFEKIVSKNDLEPDKLYLQCYVSEVYRDKDQQDQPAMARIQVRDLDRYYMNEKLAKPAENAFRDALRSGIDAHLELKILHNQAVPVQLYIDGKTVEEYLEAN